jgi:hypothetical protein
MRKIISPARIVARFSAQIAIHLLEARVVHSLLDVLVETPRTPIGFIRFRPKNPALTWLTG